MSLATWAADCAERVLPLFEKAYLNDDRPRKAIAVCQEWVRTGMFKMSTIRGASLAAHAAAREVKENVAACFAARSAGQAVATAHVSQHAFGAAYYALKAIAAADPSHAWLNVSKELDRQAQCIPANLREEVLKRIVIEKSHCGAIVKMLKDESF